MNEQVLIFASRESYISKCQLEITSRYGFNPWVGKIPWRRKWLPTPIFLLEEFYGQRSLAGYNPWDSTESVMTEHVHTQIMHNFLV